MTIDQAILFAAEAHAGQRRKDAIAGFELPYVTHPLEVLKQVWKWGAADDNTGSAAVLHDVVEDCSVSPIEIEQRFGGQVALLVQQLTLLDGGDKLGYLQSFGDPDRTRIEAFVIKLADRVCNVRDYALSNPTYAAKYLQKASVLGEALQSRLREIEKRWNQETATKIQASWNCLWMELVGSLPSADA